MDLAIIGHRLKLARVDKCLTLAELAKLTGVTNVTISRLENGKHYPALYTVVRLAEALDIRLSDLFEEGKDENVR